MAPRVHNSMVARILSQFTEARGWQIMRRGQYERGGRVEVTLNAEELWQTAKRGLIYRPFVGSVLPLSDAERSEPLPV